MATERNRESRQKRRPKRESTSFKTPKTKTPLGDNRAKKKKKNDETNDAQNPTPVAAGSLPPSEQLSYFLERYQSANGLKLSSLELEAIEDTCMLELSQGLDQDAESLSIHMKAAFGKLWKEVLYEGQLVDGNVDPGSPAVLTISTSALRSLELLRGLRPLTRECHAAKLFAKHMKVEEQVSVLRSRVNIASGTPSRIKKLIDIDALGLSRLSVVVIDMHTDAKGYSLFTLPQVSDEFWDLYKSHFHHRIVEGDLRICLYGSISRARETKKG